MRKIMLLFSVAILIFAATDTNSQLIKKRVVFIPFYDESGYIGPWDISVEMPEMLGDMLGGADDYFEVIPMNEVVESMPKLPEKSAIGKFFKLFSNEHRVQVTLTDSQILDVARKVNADLVITGLITDFNMKRTGGGEPMVGGYKRYTTQVGLDQVRVLRMSDGRPLGTVRGEEKKTSQGLGLELFGKPRQMDLEFTSMDSLDFGSKRFISTMWGQTTIEALNKVNKELRTVVARPDSGWFASKKFKILSIDGGNPIINAGSDDSVNPGDVFTVYASESEVRVGKIRVLTVWSAHVARCEVLDGKDTIRPDDFIMPQE